MSQTPEGVIKMKATIREKYGVTEDGKSKFHVEVGALGGRVKSPTKGFGWDERTRLQKILRKKKRAAIAGRKGGQISRRRSKDVSN